MDGIAAGYNGTLICAGRKGSGMVVHDDDDDDNDDDDGDGDGDGDDDYLFIYLFILSSGGWG